jgi:hypothetical protein
MRIQRFSVGGEDRISQPPQFYIKYEPCTALLHSPPDDLMALELG